MRLSVIVPNGRPPATFARTLASLDVAARGLDVEKIVVADPERRGPSWARNVGLGRATGEIVFFCDDDDTVRPDFFQALVALLERSGADFALSSLAIGPLKRDYNLAGRAAIRDAMLPAFFGYSFDDVRRWNAGGDLMARRELGSVLRGAFRRDFLARYAIRFDEALRIGEDAAFLAECALRAERTASTEAILYDYAPAPTGLMDSSYGTDRQWAYKFPALANRKAMCARCGVPEAMRHFEASAVFSTLELLKARRDWRRYAADPFVRGAIAAFPTSWRHPLVAAAVRALDFTASVLV